MVEPTLEDLQRNAERAGGVFGQAKPAERADAARVVAVARLAYHAAKILDGCPEPITQEDADYICSVIATRVASAESAVSA